MVVATADLPLPLMALVVAAVLVLLESHPDQQHPALAVMVLRLQLAVHRLLTLEAVGVEHIFHLQLEHPVALEVAETEQLRLMRVTLELQTLAVVVVVDRQVNWAEMAAQVLSSSRPINNEDKWKPKSIGCMESTPQCTC
jgi:hypothetical protein